MRFEVLYPTSAVGGGILSVQIPPDMSKSSIEPQCSRTYSLLQDVGMDISIECCYADSSDETVL
jgi:hypothetical protein